MDRRSFLRTSGMAAGAAAGGVLAAPAIARGAQALTMVLSWPKAFPGLGTSAERFARRFEAATDGRYRIAIHGGGELVHPLKCLDAVRDGTADLYHSAEYYYQDKATAFSFFCTVPFGFTAAEMDAWLHHGGGRQLWDELSAGFGVKPFPCGNTGAQMGGWFKKPITDIADFQGLKMRIPGLAGDVLRSLGGIPVTLAGSEILSALQAGTIDAAEWVGPYNDLAFGFHKVVKHYHYPGFHEPGPVLSLGVRRALWERMSKADQAVLEACALAENTVSLADFNAHNSRALHTLITEHGVRLHEFSDAIFKAAGEATRDVLAAAGRSDPFTAKVYESFLDFRKRMVHWSSLAEQSYMAKRALTGF